MTDNHRSREGKTQVIALKILARRAGVDRDVTAKMVDDAFFLAGLFMCRCEARYAEACIKDNKES